MTPQQHKESLIHDFLEPDSEFRRSEACLRLGYYYRDALEPLALKVLAGEPRVGGTEVIGIELVDRPDGADEETVTERRIQYEADTEFT